MRKNKVELKKHDTDNFSISILRTKKTLYKKGHKHSHYEIMNIQANHSDEQYYFIDNAKYAINSSVFLFSPSDVTHGTLRTSTNSVRTLLNFTAEFAKPVFDFLEIDIDKLFSNRVHYYSKAQLKEIHTTARLLENEYHNATNPAKIKLLFASLIELLVHAESYPQPVSASSDNLKIEQIINYIKVNYSEPITLEYLEKKLFINKFYICREVKRCTGLSFTSLLTDIRIKHACELLENSMLSISDIALEVGYNSPTYFSIAFKNNIGMAPTDYRNRLGK